MNTIAIDCGSSFIKGAAFKDGKIIRQAQHQSPKQIADLIPLVKKLFADLVQGEKEVKLCMSNEMHGFLLAHNNGKPYTDYISWQKEFGHNEVNGTTAFRELSSESFKNDILATGMPLRSGLPSVNLYYMKLSGQVDLQEDLKFYTLGDYILSILAGKDVSCHPTNAAATGLYDITASNWNRNLIDFISLPHIHFLKVGTEETLFDYNGIKVHSLPALGDQQAALLGAGVDKENILSFNLGTGGQASMAVKSYKLSDTYQIRPYFNGLYLKTIPHLPSGRAINVFVRFVKDILTSYGNLPEDKAVWRVLLEQAEAAEDTELSCELSFFANPVTKKVKGSIGEIGEFDLSLGTLFKSIFEKTAKDYIWAARQIIEKESIERIVFSGGVARKIKLVRENILKEYKDTPFTVSQNETLTGLEKYSRMERF